MIEIKKIKKEYEYEHKEYYCDICNKNMTEDMKHPKRGIIIEDIKEYVDLEYGDGGYSETNIYDICENCKKEILIPFIKEKCGKEPRLEELDW